MPISRRLRLRALLSITVVVLIGGAALSASAADNAAARWNDARQMVLVTIPDWNSTQGSLRTYARESDGWHQVGQPQPVVIGRAGAAWGLGLQASQPGGPVKREGDGRSPAGVFRIGTAFGYAPGADTHLPYRALTANDWCVDVSGSPYYNRIVDADTVGAAAVKDSTEPMRRDLHAHGDQRYREGFVIESNWQQRPMGGSCIFGHLWKSPTSTTSGCTAMAPRTMQQLLAWLDPRRHPVFVLLPRDQYARLHQAWQLPGVDATP